MGLKIFQDINLRAALSAAAASQYEMLPGAKFGRLMSAACSDALNGRGVAQLIMPGRRADPSRGRRGRARKAAESSRGAVVGVLR